jgi:hypothetical protein
MTGKQVFAFYLQACTSLSTIHDDDDEMAQWYLQFAGRRLDMPVDFEEYKRRFYVTTRTNTNPGFMIVLNIVMPFLMINDDTLDILVGSRLGRYFDHGLERGDSPGAARARTVSNGHLRLGGVVPASGGVSSSKMMFIDDGYGYGFREVPQPARFQPKSTLTLENPIKRVDHKDAWNDFRPYRYPAGLMNEWGLRTDICCDDDFGPTGVVTSESINSKPQRSWFAIRHAPGQPRSTPPPAVYECLYRDIRVMEFHVIIDSRFYLL